MAEINAGEIVKSVHYANARLRLEKLGVTDYQIMLIEEAEERHFEGSPTKGYRIRNETYDPRGELEWAKNLRRLNIVERIGERYWLTRDGQSFRDNLLIHKPSAATRSNVPVVASFEEQMDVDLFRDGLLKTVGKIYWFWANHDMIKERRMQEWLREFQEGQKEIDEAIAGILAPREPIIVQPVKHDNPYWTEEHQRKQNDDYWATGGAAFWFNPRGILADPTPAPDWWVMPEYKPKVAIPDMRDDIVERSLLAPVTGPQGVTGPPGLPEGFRHATPEEIAEKNREKMLDELFAELDHLNEVEDEFYDSEDWYEEVMVSKAAMSSKSLAKNVPGLPYVKKSSKSGLFIVEYNDQVHGFPNQDEANTFLNTIRAAERARLKEQEMKRMEQEQRAAQRAIQDELIRAAKRKIRDSGGTK